VKRKPKVDLHLRPRERRRLRRNLRGTQVMLTTGSTAEVVSAGYNVWGEPQVVVLIAGITGMKFDAWGIGIPNAARWIVGWDACRMFTEPV